MNNALNKIKEYLLPSVAVGILFLAVLASNGLWPFGKETIDYYDMAQWSDLFYYHNYDELHGVKSFIFDWYVNLGRVVPGLNEPSPFDLLFYFVPRRSMLECMSILMLIKIMAAALTMNIFVRYINKELPYVFRLMISAGYGMCGFIIVNYTVPMWLDMAVLVPLVLMFAQKALATGRYLGLSVTIFLLMIDDYYFTIQTLMFVFFIGGAYIIYRKFSVKDGPRTDDLYVLRLCIGVLFGLALSAFSWIPDIMNATTSARFGNGADSGIIGMYKDILSNTTPAYLSRWFALLGLAAPAAIVAVGLIANIRKKRIASAIYVIAIILMPVSQLLLESIHLMLHFGSYVNYPVRNGFMIYCIVAAAAAKIAPVPVKESSSGMSVIFTAVGIACVAALTVLFRWGYYHSGRTFSDHDVLIFTMGLMVLFMIIHIALITIRDGMYKNGCIFLWITEILIFGMIMIGKPQYVSGYGEEPEQEGEYIRITDQLVNGFDDKLKTGDEAATHRIKNPDTSLNANYGEVMQRETLSGWTNLATAGQIGGAISLGYSNQFTRILDSGGTVFSDTMLHITDIVSHMELDDRLYEKTATTKAVIDHMTGQTAEYHLYRNRFEMPFAIPVIRQPKIDLGDSEIVDTLNEYASSMGASSPVASEVQSPAKTDHPDGSGLYEYNIDIKGHKTLYYTGKCTDTDHYNTRISVNGKAVRIPSIKENDNELFPAHFNNNTVELGSFNDETVKVTVDMDVSDPARKYDFIVFELDTDVLSELCADMPENDKTARRRHGLEIELSNDSGKYSGVLVPVPFANGWTAKINDREGSVSDVGGLFMYVAIPEGNVRIDMSYFPPYMRTGSAVAILAFICFVFTVIKGIYDRPVTGIADRILTYVYMAGFAASFIVVYVIPVLYVPVALGR